MVSFTSYNFCSQITADFTSGTLFHWVKLIHFFENKSNCLLPWKHLFPQRTSLL